MSEATKKAPDFAVAKEIVPNGPHYEFPGEAQAIVPVTPMSAIQLAMNQNADIDKLEKLWQLQLQFEANEARKAFVVAMAAFKSEPIDIAKNRTAAFGEGARAVSYDYATLDNVCRQVTHGLSKHGISHRWVIEQKDSLIRVTCILTHERGHSEETTLSAGADTTGSKNAIQAIGSAVTYLERYTLLAATGLAAKNGDDDAAPKMDDFKMHVDRIKCAVNAEALKRAYADAVKAALEAKDTKAMQAIMDAKEARRAALAKEEAA